MKLHLTEEQGHTFREYCLLIVVVCALILLSKCNPALSSGAFVIPH